MILDARHLTHRALNERILTCPEEHITVKNCLGQRYLGCGLAGKHITCEGTPGNALGAYLDGAVVELFGNAQDAVGDTMNEGELIIHGSSGDATGYAMRGGKIFVRGNVGYRAGIHMKAYEDKLPVLVVGGCAGSFLGEYQAGGMIVVLNLEEKQLSPVGSFCAAGMHGGRIYLRTGQLPGDLPEQVIAQQATPEDMGAIDGVLEEFCQVFGVEKQKVMEQRFYVLRSNTKNPYRQMYVHN